MYRSYLSTRRWLLFGIGINILVNELIENYPGCGSDTVAYSSERLFQIESNIPVQFESEDDMMVHIWSNYNR